MNPAEGEWENSAATATATAADDAIQSKQIKTHQYATSENRSDSRPVDMQPVRIGAHSKLPNFIQNGMGIAEEIPIGALKPAPHKGFNRQRPGEIGARSPNNPIASITAHKMANSVGLGAINRPSEGSYIASEGALPQSRRRRAKNYPNNPSWSREITLIIHKITLINLGGVSIDRQSQRRCFVFCEIRHKKGTNHTKNGTKSCAHMNKSSPIY